jgi:hypothetical protein
MNPFRFPSDTFRRAGFAGAFLMQGTVEDLFEFLFGAKAR